MPLYAIYGDKDTDIEVGLTYVNVFISPEPQRGWEADVQNLKVAKEQLEMSSARVREIFGNK